MKDSNQGSAVASEPSNALKSYRSVISGYLSCRNRISDLIIDVNAIEAILNNPSCHSIRCRHRISTGRGRGIGRTKCRNEQFDPCSGILRFDGCPIRSGYELPLQRLVCGTRNKQEGEYTGRCRWTCEYQETLIQKGYNYKTLKPCETTTMRLGC